MASMYDQIETGTRNDGTPIIRNRLNKQFIGDDKVPEAVKKVVNLNNIVDENGLVIVDNKNEAAKEPTPDNKKELTPEEAPKLDRIDDQKPASPEDAPTAPSEPKSEPVSEGEEEKLQNGPADQPAPPEASVQENPAPTTTAPVNVDDSANEELDATPPPEEPKQEDTTPEPEKDKAAPKVTTAPPVAEPVAKERVAPEPPKVPKSEPAPSVQKLKSKVPQSNPGMGFPRKNGRTSDIFDINVPHTKVKLVGGHAVPLSEESFRSRSESEIVARLKELGFEVIDYNELASSEGVNTPGGNDLLLEDEEADEDINLS